MKISKPIKIKMKKQKNKQKEKMEGQNVKQILMK